MNCMTLTAQDITMTTTQFTRDVCYESCLAVEEVFVPQHQPLRLNWIVVTDENQIAGCRSTGMRTGKTKHRSALANSL